jgi:hypothetical protein
MHGTKRHVHVVEDLVIRFIMIFLLRESAP